VTSRATRRRPETRAERWHFSSLHRAQDRILEERLAESLALFTMIHGQTREQHHRNIVLAVALHELGGKPLLVERCVHQRVIRDHDRAIRARRDVVAHDAFPLILQSVVAQVQIERRHAAVKRRPVVSPVERCNSPEFRISHPESTVR
jgi:hypothetical protein